VKCNTFVENRHVNIFILILSLLADVGINYTMRRRSEAAANSFQRSGQAGRCQYRVMASMAPQRIHDPFSSCAKATTSELHYGISSDQSTRQATEDGGFESKKRSCRTEEHTLIDQRAGLSPSSTTKSSIYPDVNTFLATLPRPSFGQKHLSGEKQQTFYASEDNRSTTSVPRMTGRAKVTSLRSSWFTQGAGRVGDGTERRGTAFQCACCFSEEDAEVGQDGMTSWSCDGLLGNASHRICSLCAKRYLWSCYETGCMSRLSVTQQRQCRFPCLSPTDCDGLIHVSLPVLFASDERAQELFARSSSSPTVILSTPVVTAARPAAQLPATTGITSKAPVEHPVSSSSSSTQTCTTSHSTATRGSIEDDCAVGKRTVAADPLQDEAMHLLRRGIKEHITNTLLRRCPTCRLPFVKSDEGCNKIRCPSCRTTSCYCCNRPVKDYEHFSNFRDIDKTSLSLCPLWTSHAVDLQRDAMRLQETICNLANQVWEEYLLMPER
jgi:hypothetical protein